MSAVARRAKAECLAVGGHSLRHLQRAAAPSIEPALDVVLPIEMDRFCPDEVGYDALPTLQRVAQTSALRPLPDMSFAFGDI